MNVKGKGQRLIPEELLKYLEAFKENHPDPTQGGGATLDDIVDSQGNKRFIEADGEVVTEASKLTPSYCKWSLSGTHLMCVLAGTVTANVYIGSSVSMANFTLPSYIGSKIFPVYRKAVETRVIVIYDENGLVSQEVKFQFQYQNNVISFVPQEDIHITSVGYFRIQFDLLIDAS